MIHDVTHNKIHSRDKEVLNYIQANKLTSVIDIGAARNSWSSSVTTAIVDIVPYDTDKKLFSGNINYFDVWQELLAYVEEHGKFDFCICTHTLEDISNPGLVASMFSRIAKAGFVAFPSKYRELVRVRPFYGWMHHRWIFNHEGDKVIGYPKLAFTEYLDYLKQVGKDDDSIEELSFFWKDTCDLEIVSNDYFESENFMVEIFENLTK
jgi:hypothetical protein